MTVNVIIPAEITKFPLSIAGGLSAKLFGAAAELCRRSLGKLIRADLGYFDLRKRLASNGARRVVTIWLLAVRNQGISKGDVLANAEHEQPNTSFRGGERLASISSPVLGDNGAPTKFRSLTIKGKVEAVQFLFRVLGPCSAIHLHRENDVNDSTLTVPRATAVDCAYRPGGNYQHLLVNANSRVDIAGIDLFRKPLKHKDVINDTIGVSRKKTKDLLRGARVLFSSNSQFPLSGGLFSNNGGFASDRCFGTNHVNANVVYRKSATCFYQINSDENDAVFSKHARESR